ncbi:hypothetical protein [Gordonia soli]|uniref:Uncharacterized protein n=1 Tax=Gordonia soli NBRC 108243 TaxID=1223545 RepID=M0QL34_9ACTN|nr:hypothetical protein [Gordonia soli]GAC68996.1 hypothetical protein GS4_20_00610 [Gordonia soli NBRC 108243]
MTGPGIGASEHIGDGPRGADWFPTNKPPNLDDWGKGAPGGRVVSTSEDWKTRAKVATDAAQAIRESIDLARGILGTNFFGAGCPEGVNLQAKLRAALLDSGGWAQNLSLQFTALEKLSQTASQTGEEFSATDQSASRPLTK